MEGQFPGTIILILHHQDIWALPGTRLPPGNWAGVFIELGLGLGSGFGMGFRRPWCSASHLALKPAPSLTVSHAVFGKCVCVDVNVLPRRQQVPVHPERAVVMVARRLVDVHARDPVAVEGVVGPYRGDPAAEPANSEDPDL